MSEHIIDRVGNTTTTARDITGLFFGKKIGEGMSREVYECTPDPKVVLKLETAGTRFQNVLEWEVWNTIKDTPFAKWFAPCVDISANGIVLVQKKAERIPLNQYPKMIPHFFMDTKYENFGMIGKQFVCFDYGTAHIEALNKFFTNKSMKRLQMKKAEWWKGGE